MREKAPATQEDVVSGGQAVFPGTPRPGAGAGLLCSPRASSLDGAGVLALGSRTFKSCVFFFSNFKKQAGRASVKSTLMKWC